MIKLLITRYHDGKLKLKDVVLLMDTRVVPRETKTIAKKDKQPTKINSTNNQTPVLRGSARCLRPRGKEGGVFTIRNQEEQTRVTNLS